MKRGLNIIIKYQQIISLLVCQCINLVYIGRARRFNTLKVSVRVTKTFRSCRPAWLEMDRKVCPIATTSHTSSYEMQFSSSEIDIIGNGARFGHLCLYVHCC